MTKEQPTPISLVQEVQRKLVHLSSLWIPAVIALLDRPYALTVLLCAALPLVALDVARNFLPAVQAVAVKWFGRILREHETTPGHFALTGASYMLLAALACVTIFSKPVAACAMLVLVLADTAAALVGRRWGRIRLGDKTLEGCAAFFVTAYACVALVALFTPDALAFLRAGFVPCLGTTAMELISKRLRLDDNLTIPVVFALMMGGM